jgi:hypothetical protein
VGGELHIMDKAVKWLSVVVFLLASVPAQARQDAPPYLYYYSSTLGGIIVERADGSDSRHLAADVIPPDMTGLAGPGWSPSGQYFAAYQVTYGPYTVSGGTPYVIDAQGHAVANWLQVMAATVQMQWSPTGEDILLIIGRYQPDYQAGTFFWLLDADTGGLLVDFGANLESVAESVSTITWDVANGQIAFTIAPNSFAPQIYYRVIMRFDGTTVRQPVGEEQFWTAYQEVVPEDSEDLFAGRGMSPSGNYEALGVQHTVLTDTRTGEEVFLPMHTQGTICREYVWSENEDYIITINGTLLAGGGCGPAVLGVTDREGKLWRELGGCSWRHPPCIDWLPEQVDVTELPSGAPTPVQLDPSTIDYAVIDMPLSVLPTVPTRLRCGPQFTADIVDHQTNETLYTLKGIRCPYAPDTSFADEGLPIVIAYQATHDLLATFYDYHTSSVTLWTRRNGFYERILRLNTEGYALEFTADGDYLRAGNVNAWKVFSVADILAVAE